MLSMIMSMYVWWM